MSQSLATQRSLLKTILENLQIRKKKEMLQEIWEVGMIKYHDIVYC